MKPENVDQHTLRQRRQELGLTQESLAEKLKVSQGAIARWESGKHQMRTMTRIAIAYIFCELEKEQNES